MIDTILSALYLIANDQTLTASDRSQADSAYQRVTICKRLLGYGAPMRNVFLAQVAALKKLVYVNVSVDELRDAAVAIFEAS